MKPQPQRTHVTSAMNHPSELDMCLDKALELQLSCTVLSNIHEFGLCLYR